MTLKKDEAVNDDRSITEKALQLAIAHIDKQYGKGSIVRLGDRDLAPWPAISTRALTLDKALGIGGVPLGRITEIYGPESAGKSTLCLSLIRSCQEKGGKALYIDVEHAVDPLYAQSMGVNLDDLIFSQPGCAEEALDILTSVVATGAIDLVIIDSIAALVPKAELEGDMGDQQMGLQARIMSKAMRRIAGKASENMTAVVFTNQLRQKIGIVYGNPETTPGGLAVKYQASVRMDIRKKGDIKDPLDGFVIGSNVEVKVVKNKMAPPLRIAKFDIMYGKGIDGVGALFDMSLDAGIFSAKGAWIYYIKGEGEVFAQGRDKAIVRLKDEPEILKEVEYLLENGINA